MKLDDRTTTAETPSKKGAAQPSIASLKQLHTAVHETRDLRPGIIAGGARQRLRARRPQA